MTLQEAIEARHSVRSYKDQPLAHDVVKVLSERVSDINRDGRLHIQLILNEKKAFQGTIAKYGKFRNVSSYFVMAGKKTDDLDELIGYYGEQLVLLAQTLGLNTCWVGLSYSKIPGTYVLEADEKICCYIALGYGETQGVGHKIKTVEQQKFSFEYLGVENNTHKVRANKGFSMMGYTRIDLGIAKCHFEIGAGQENFVWV